MKNAKHNHNEMSNETEVIINSEGFSKLQTRNNKLCKGALALEIYRI